METFRVSSHLKDIIGRDLVVDEFVAIFELVKNSIDAGATQVQVGFAPNDGTIEIVDDGKGMSRKNIVERWLHVAFSAKRHGTEDADGDQGYRDRIRFNRRYAGSKGIGRFSCDTLGAELDLYSRETEAGPVEHLHVDWKDFEADDMRRFEDVPVTDGQIPDFPILAACDPPRGHGTVLVIKHVRAEWGPDKIALLRRNLAKLIDPFGTSREVEVATRLAGSSDPTLVGPVGNDIANVLRDKTTRILVGLNGRTIETSLIDRGKLIYRIREPIRYSLPLSTTVCAEIYYLNRSAKQTFSRRMEVPVVEFGSIFLFLNGFRIFPIGEEFDDTFGLNRRKQQGSSRYLGTRDVLGKVEVEAPPGAFREASSRDAGLIDDANSRELIELIRRQAIFRLERYVVGVTWADKADADRDSPEGLSAPSARARIISVVGNLAGARDVELIDYAKDLVDVVEERTGAFERTMGDLEAIAERDGSPELLRRVEEARARQAELERSEREARERADKAVAAARQADARIATLDRQVSYLSARSGLSIERLEFILHQAAIHAGHIAAATAGGLGHLRRANDLVVEIARAADAEDREDLVAALGERLADVGEAFARIDLDNERLTATTAFALHLRADVREDAIAGDLLAFLSEYVAEVRAARDGHRVATFDDGGLRLEGRFKPVDLVLVVDNLIDNARKSNAQRVEFVARRAKGSKGLEVVVSDDGHGLGDHVDAPRIFDKGYTGTYEGTGLGLYNVRYVLEQMGGAITLDPLREPRRATFIINLPGSVEAR